MEVWSNFKDNQYGDDTELLFGMRELNQRWRELKMTEDEWVAVWMLGIIKRRKKLDKFVYQSLRDIIKIGGDNVIKNFEEKFKELCVEGNRQETNSSSVMFTEEEFASFLWPSTRSSLNFSSKFLITLYPPILMIS